MKTTLFFNHLTIILFLYHLLYFWIFHFHVAYHLAIPLQTIFHLAIWTLHSHASYHSSTLLRIFFRLAINIFLFHSFFHFSNLLHSYDYQSKCILPYLLINPFPNYLYILIHLQIYKFHIHASSHLNITLHIQSHLAVSPTQDHFVDHP